MAKMRLRVSCMVVGGWCDPLRIDLRNGMGSGRMGPETFEYVSLCVVVVVLLLLVLFFDEGGGELVEWVWSVVGGAGWRC